MTTRRRWRNFVWLLALGLGLVLGGCARLPLFDRRADLELTWQKAVVALPGRNGAQPLVGIVDRMEIDKELVRIAGRGRWPVVVYLHGCNGIGRYDFLRRLARAGYVVVAPDSLARRYRPLQCDPKAIRGGENLFVYEFRLAEVSYALQQLTRADWVDADNLFLVGASEGGVAAALYRGGEFRARIIAMWTCQGRPLVRGIAAPPSTPILTVVRANDPWYAANRTAGQNGSCREFLEGRPGSRSIVAEGAEHNVFNDARLVRQMVEFLDRNRH